jgi:DNA polymerase-3 subunit beta
VRFLVESGRATLRGRNTDAGQAVEELEVDYEGEPFEASFNARYLQDVLAQMSGQATQFRLAEQTSGSTAVDPVLAVDPVDAGVQYVLVPLRA